MCAAVHLYKLAMNTHRNQTLAMQGLGQQITYSLAAKMKSFVGTPPPRVLQLVNNSASCRPVHLQALAS